MGASTPRRIHQAVAVYCAADPQHAFHSLSSPMRSRSNLGIIYPLPALRAILLHYSQPSASPFSPLYPPPPPPPLSTSKPTSSQPWQNTSPTQKSQPPTIKNQQNQRHKNQKAKGKHYTDSPPPSRSSLTLEDPSTMLRCSSPAASLRCCLAGRGRSGLVYTVWEPGSPPMRRSCW